MIGGIFANKTETPTIPKKRITTKTENEPFFLFASCGTRSPGYVAFTAHGLPCLSVDNS